jgi:hypothetical protein
VIQRIVKIVLLSELFAVGTYALGWWTVPVIALLWAFLTRDANRAMFAALCAALGWTTLLLLDLARGPVLTMASRLGGVMGIPSMALLAVTLVFPALLAWSAAALAVNLRRPETTGRPTG